MSAGWRFNGSRGSGSGKRRGSVGARRRGPAGSSPRRILGDDETGVFPIVEAILVAVLVLTAILFLTSVQRPTLGAEEAGLDLGQVSNDSLRLLQSTQQFGPFEVWVTDLANGRPAVPPETTSTADKIHRYLAGTRGDGVLPKGALYQLRLDNGVSSIPILPAGGAEAPRGARAAHVTLLPDWTAFKDEPAAWRVHPGEVIPTGDPRLGLVDTSAAYACLKSPTGQSTLVDLGDSGTVADNWVDHWKAVPPVANSLTPPVLWKRTQNQVPLDALYGTWAAYTNAGCTAGETFFRVVRPDDPIRWGSAKTGPTAETLATLTGAPGFFKDSDEGKPITGFLADGTSAIPDDTVILTVVGDTATISNDATADPDADITIIVGTASPYAAYGLQLVVWFGA